MPTTLESTRGNQSAFDRLLNWIISLKIKGQNVGELERDVLELERRVQVFDDESLTKIVNRKLDYWLGLILKPSNTEERIEDRNVNPSFTILELQDRIHQILSMFDKAEYAPEVLTVLGDFIAVIEPKSRGVTTTWDVTPSESDKWIKKLRNLSLIHPWVDLEEFKDYQHQWRIFIRFAGKHHRASKVSKLLWLLTEALESVSGVVMLVEDQGTGSIWFTLRVFMLNLLAKDEVKDLLEKSRDAVLAEQVVKRVEGAEKIREEKLKLQAERSVIEKQTELIPDSEEAKKIRELELRRKELEIREKEADVKHKELQNYKATLDVVQQMGYLMREGLLASAPVEIKINGETFLACQDGQFLSGAAMEAIDQAGAVKPGDDEGLKQPS
jgi:hypothetical protein